MLPTDTRLPIGSTRSRQAAEEIGVPLGFSVEVLGGGRELERTIADFGWTFLLSFVFMYIVLAAQYENLVYPLIILLSLPLAIPFGLLSLYWGGETSNLYSALGILVLFGVVKKAAILQVDHTNVAATPGSRAARRDHAGQPRPLATDPDDHYVVRCRLVAVADRHRSRCRGTSFDRRVGSRRTDAFVAADAVGDPRAVHVF